MCIVGLSLKMLHLCNNLSLCWGNIFWLLCAHIRFGVQEVLLIFLIHLCQVILNPIIMISPQQIPKGYEFAATIFALGAGISTDSTQTTFTLAIVRSVWHI